MKVKGCNQQLLCIIYNINVIFFLFIFFFTINPLIPLVKHCAKCSSQFLRANRDIFETAPFIQRTVQNTKIKFSIINNKEKE